MGIGQRIRELREGKGLTLQQVGDVFGISRGAVSSWEREDTRPDQQKLPALARTLGTTVEYLLTGSMTAVRNTDTGADANVEPGPDIRGKVPLISWVQAGDWCEVVDTFAPGDAESWLPCPKTFGPHAFALRVRGISMEPKYQDGDIIFVDPGVGAEHGKNVVVRLDDDQEATFKQLVVEGDQKFLRALNPDWPGPKLIPINGNATICGVVIGKWVPE